MKIKLNILLSVLSVFVIFTIICILFNSLNSLKKTKEPISTKTIDLQIKDVLSYEGKEKFGEYGLGYYYDTLNEIELINIYNNQIKDNNLNWVTLRDANDKNKGYVFSSSHKGRFWYGTIDETDRIEKVDYVGDIVDNFIKIIRDNT